MTQTFPDVDMIIEHHVLTQLAVAAGANMDQAVVLNHPGRRFAGVAGQGGFVSGPIQAVIATLEGSLTNLIYGAVVNNAAARIRFFMTNSDIVPRDGIIQVVVFLKK